MNEFENYKKKKNEKFELHKMEVGKEFEYFLGDRKNIDGAILEAVFNGGFMLVVYLKNMSMSEQMALRTGKVQVRLIKETDTFLMPLIKFGWQLEFSLIFDPTKYTDERKDTLFESNMMTIVGVESTTNIIKTLRMANMPNRLFRTIMGSWDLAKKEENFSERYNAWVDDLYRRYDDNQLWEMGIYMGKMGE